MMAVHAKVGLLALPAELALHRIGIKLSIPVESKENAKRSIDSIARITIRAFCLLQKAATPSNKTIGNSLAC